MPGETVSLRKMQCEDCEGAGHNLNDVQCAHCQGLGWYMAGPVGDDPKWGFIGNASEIDREYIIDLPESGRRILVTMKSTTGTFFCHEGGSTTIYKFKPEARCFGPIPEDSL